MSLANVVEPLNAIFEFFGGPLLVVLFILVQVSHAQGTRSFTTRPLFVFGVAVFIAPFLVGLCRSSREIVAHRRDLAADLRLAHTGPAGGLAKVLPGARRHSRSARWRCGRRWPHRLFQVHSTTC